MCKKVKLSLFLTRHHSMNKYREWRYVSTILDLGIREVSGQLHAPAALLPGKEPPVPIGKKNGWVPNLVWTLWSTEKSLAPAGNRTTAVQHITRRCARLPRICVIIFKMIHDHILLPADYNSGNVNFITYI
jgi:hypothetical protein